MKRHTTIKFLLLIIALLLGIIVSQPSFISTAQAAPPASAKFANVSIGATQSGFYLFNQENGEIYYYANHSNAPTKVGTLKSVGDPLLF